MGKQLHAIADAQNWQAQFQKRGIQLWRIFCRNACGTAGKDDGIGIQGRNFLNAFLAGLNFGVYPGFPDAPGDKLGEL